MSSIIRRPVSDDVNAVEIMYSSWPADGWIGPALDKLNVRPYMASYGALGWVTFCSAGGPRTYLLRAEAWVRWYASNLDASGFMHDYSVTWSGGLPTLTDLGPDSMDSTDAYIGMWLMVLWHIWKLDSARALRIVTDHESDIALALAGLASTQQSDGLTWAKPSYTAKYLEDNLETLIGLRGLQQVLTGTSFTTLKAQLDPITELMAEGICMMWNAETQTWDWAIDGAGTRTVCDWANESSQRQHIWSIVYDAAPATVQGDFIDQYVAAFPNWATDITNGYEVLPIIAMRRAGRTAQADAGLAAVQANVDANGRAWPFSSASRGQLLMATRVAGAFPFPALGLDRINVSENLLTGCDTGLGNLDGAGIPAGWDTYIIDGYTSDYTAGRFHVDSANVFALISPMQTSVVAGKWHCLSVQAEQLSGNLVLKIEWYDDADALVDYTYTYWTGAYADQRRWWARIAPDGATKAKCVVTVEAGGEVYLTNVQFEHQGAPTPYVAP